MIVLIFFLIVFVYCNNYCNGFSPLLGKTVIRVNGNVDRETTDLGKYISTLSGDTLLICGTYAADFNTIEYCQKAKYYQNQLSEKNVKNILLLVNARPESIEALKNILSLPDNIVLLSDSTGDIAKSFGVSRGYRPEDNISPYLKLFMMLFGLGNAMTLPSVIGGYFGNPFVKNIGWVEQALVENTLKSRFPTTAVELDPVTDKLTKNKFADLPLVGNWNLRPLELATLRLQNMIGISLQHWDSLKPSDDELSRGLLTQLGGLVIIKEKTSEIKYKFLDDGICHTASFSSILEKL